MKIKYILLLVIMINPVYGFAGMSSGSDNMTRNASNFTDSDESILLQQHLIELNATNSQIRVRETFVYINIGMNFSGHLRTWVPDNAENIVVAMSDMQVKTLPVPIKMEKKGNIVSWNAMLYNNEMPPLYIVQYDISKNFTKELYYPVFVTKTSKDLILKIIGFEKDKIKITDESGNEISETGNPEKRNDGIIYEWKPPYFKKINVEFPENLQKPQNPRLNENSSNTLVYVIIAGFIILILLYPIIRKKMKKDE